MAGKEKVKKKEIMIVIIVIIPIITILYRNELN